MAATAADLTNLGTTRYSKGVRVTGAARRAPRSSADMALLHPFSARGRCERQPKTSPSARTLAECRENSRAVRPPPAQTARLKSSPTRTETQDKAKTASKVRPSRKAGRANER